MDLDHFLYITTPFLICILSNGKHGDCCRESNKVKCVCVCVYIMVVGTLVFRLAIHSKCWALLLSSDQPFCSPGFLASSSSSFLQDRLYFATAAAGPGYREMNSGRNEGEKETSTVIERTMWESQRSDNGRGGRKKKDTSTYICPAQRYIMVLQHVDKDVNIYSLRALPARKRNCCSIDSKGRHSFFILVQSRMIAQQLFSLLYYSGSFPSLSVLFSCLPFGLALVIFHHPPCPHGIDHPFLLSITNYKREPAAIQQLIIPSQTLLTQ